MITDYLNRVLALEEVEETFGPSPYFNPQLDLYKALPLTRFPVTTIESITWGGNAWGAGEPLDPTAYRLDQEAGLIYRSHYNDWYGYSGYAWPGSPIVVRYWGGYALLGDLPRAIEAACLTLLRYRNTSGNRDPYVSMERVYELQEIRYFNRTASTESSYSIPNEVAAMLRPYRREIS